MTKKTVNYRRDYTCSGCGTTGVKLWRDYNTCASAVELKCAECATPAQVTYEAKNYNDKNRDALGSLDADGVFTFRSGDQLGGLVPAVPTAEGDTFWGYSSVPDEEVEWWLALPTYRDDAREIRCLRQLLMRNLKSKNWARKALNEKRREIDDLKWKRDRTTHLPTRSGLGREITIWGTITKDLGDGNVVRYGGEKKHKLAHYDLIVEAYGRAYLIVAGDEDKLERAYTIVDHDQDGQKIIAALLAEDAIGTVAQRWLEARDRVRRSDR
jgi:hypothetical protein